MEIQKEKILEGLMMVADPATGQDIISRNMVRDMVIDGDNVNFTLVLPDMNSPHKSDLNFACMSIIQQAYPQANVNIHNTAMPTMNLGASITNAATGHIKNIIAVASGKGGVGKSTVAVNLALGLKKTGASVGLLDGDLYGPSIPTMLGLKGKRPSVKKLYGVDKIVPLEYEGIPVMSIGFIVEPEQAVVLRGPRLAEIIKQFLNDVIWPPLDYLVIDLPPGTGDIQLTLVQTVPVTGAVIVTTPQDVAVDDAIKAMNMFLMNSIKVPVLGVVENMAWFTPAELPDNKYYIFGKGGGETLAKFADTVVLGQVPLVQSIRESGDAGKPTIMTQDSRVADVFMDIAKNTIKQVEKRNAELPVTEVVKITT